MVLERERHDKPSLDIARPVPASGLLERFAAGTRRGGRSACTRLRHGRRPSSDGGGYAGPRRDTPALSGCRSTRNDAARWVSQTSSASTMSDLACGHRYVRCYRRRTSAMRASAFATAFGPVHRHATTISFDSSTPSTSAERMTISGSALDRRRRNQAAVTTATFIGFAHAGDAVSPCIRRARRDTSSVMIGRDQPRCTPAITLMAPVWAWLRPIGLVAKMMVARSCFSLPCRSGVQTAPWQVL